MFEPDPRLDRHRTAIVDAAVVLDAALDSFPLAPVPSGLVRRALARITPRPVVRFRLEFLDFAVPLFLVTFVILTVWAAFWTLNYVSPYWMLEWATQLKINQQWLMFKAMQIPSWLPALLAILGSLSVLVMGFIAILLAERTFLSLRLKH